MQRQLYVYFTLALSFIVVAVHHIYRGRSRNFEDFHLNDVSKVKIDQSTFISKGAVTKEQCKAMIKIAKQNSFGTESEPVDGKPEYQINILDDGEILHSELWKICRNIYQKYKEKDGEDDYMFLKRYKTGERRALVAHSDAAHYTVSVLLSSDKSFQGCLFYLFDDKGTEFINKKFAGFDDDDKKSYINSLGDALPIVDFEQGDVIRFDSRRKHGVTDLQGGERYLLTIFYGTEHID